MTIKVGAATPTGAHMIKITATGGSVTKTTTITLTVTP
jgi:hypothetical protein